MCWLYLEVRCIQTYMVIVNGVSNVKKYNIKNLLIFEGEIVDELKNGNGKGYINGKLEFEGEYLNNKKWNGKGYDENGNIMYELFNGNGKVKEYDFTGRNIIKN